MCDSFRAMPMISLFPVVSSTSLSGGTRVPVGFWANRRNEQQQQNRTAKSLGIAIWLPILCYFSGMNAFPSGGPFSPLLRRLRLLLCCFFATLTLPALA